MSSDAMGKKLFCSQFIIKYVKNDDIFTILHATSHLLLRLLMSWFDGRIYVSVTLQSLQLHTAPLVSTETESHSQDNTVSLSEKKFPGKYLTAFQ